MTMAASGACKPAGTHRESASLSCRQRTGPVRSVVRRFDSCRGHWACPRRSGAGQRSLYSLFRRSCLWIVVSSPSWPPRPWAAWWPARASPHRRRRGQGQAEEEGPQEAAAAPGAAHLPRPEPHLQGRGARGRKTTAPARPHGPTVKDHVVQGAQRLRRARRLRRDARREQVQGHGRLRRAAQGQGLGQGPQELRGRHEEGRQEVRRRPQEGEVEK